MLKIKQRVIEDTIPKDLFALLACPLCKADLEYTEDKKRLVCSECGEKYRIEDGIPILLPQKEAKSLK